ncbi:MAG: response regulator [Verrucomicrobiota bacterium]
MNALSHSILLAEDDESDVFLLRRAFKEVGLTNPVHVVADGQAAIDFLTQAKSREDERMPALILLDLKMPRRTGLQVLQWIREQPLLRSLPVFIFSSSENRNDVENAYDGGATAYLIKPPSLAERADLARFLKDWLRTVQPGLSVSESVRAAQAQRALRG